mmetsp:Transcript_61950/g.135486  ORF Transcript_61950/g.135486 Transcript_61950/m.135486 type:complete len:230 (+) Transcript_61950:65-754(+)
MAGTEEEGTVQDKARIFMTRHGARIDKEDRNWLSKAGHRRHDDPHLSSAGELASRELAAKLQTMQREAPLSHIVSSPFLRCVQTAQPIAEALGIPIKLEPGICEVLTIFPPNFLEPDELAKLCPNIDLTYEPSVSRRDLRQEYGDGQAARRAGAAASQVQQRLRGNILFVGHGASCLGIAEAFGGDGYVGYTSLSEFRRSSKTGRWQPFGRFGDVSHLSDPETSLNSAF